MLVYYRQNEKILIKFTNRSVAFFHKWKEKARNALVERLIENVMLCLAIVYVRQRANTLVHQMHTDTIFLYVDCR